MAVRTFSSISCLSRHSSQLIKSLPLHARTSVRLDVPRNTRKEALNGAVRLADSHPIRSQFAVAVLILRLALAAEMLSPCVLSQVDWFPLCLQTSGDATGTSTWYEWHARFPGKPETSRTAWTKLSVSKFLGLFKWEDKSATGKVWIVGMLCTRHFRSRARDHYSFC